MAVKSAKKAIEAAGLSQEAVEKPQEAVQEAQEAPEEGKAGGNTQEPEKPQEGPQEALQEAQETLVYVGPSLPRGLLKQNSIFVGTREQVEKSLEEVINKYPMAGKMLVPVSKLAEAKVKIASKGNILYKYYADIVSLIGAEFKE